MDIKLRNKNKINLNGEIFPFWGLKKMEMWNEK